MYVGKTVKPVSLRLHGHLTEARQGGGRPMSRWLRALHDQGLRPAVIDLEVVEPGRDWIEAEQFWIAAFRVTGARLLNIAEGGQGSDGKIYTPEQRQRLSDAHKHQRRTPEIIAKYRLAMATRRAAGVKRKPASAETAAKISETNKRLIAEGKMRTRKGQKLTAEQRARISAGKRTAMTDEVRARISAAKRGTIVSDEAKAALRVAQQARRAAELAAGGATFSAEGLANMRAAQQRRRERERSLAQL